ncbi:MAG: tetratricopeptide repeat protein [Phycisphaerae bacterium]|nr:tetratricopeptide repeat protein [Phycisphaerae bacterium]
MDAADADRQFAEGHAHHLAGRLHQAEQIYRAILATNPDHPDALHYLGVIALQVGRAPAAVEMIGRSVALAPNSGSLNNLGEALRLTGRLTDAMSCFEKSAQMSPANADALANQGVVLAQQNRIEEAEAKLRQAIAVNANHAGAWGMLANVLERSQRTTDAVFAWERAARLAPRHVDYRLRLAESLFRSDDVFRAIAEYRQAVELVPNEGRIRSRLAILLLAANKQKEALDESARAIELAPNVASVHGERGQILERTKQLAQAEEEYRRAISLDPQNAEQYGAHAGALISMDRYEEAIEQLKRGQAIAPADPRFVINLAKVYARAQSPDESLIYARESVRIAPHNADSHAALAFSLLARGELEEGFREYEWRWRALDFTTEHAISVNQFGTARISPGEHCWFTANKASATPCSFFATFRCCWHDASTLSWKCNTNSPRLSAGCRPHFV